MSDPCFDGAMPGSGPPLLPAAPAVATGSPKGRCGNLPLHACSLARTHAHLLSCHSSAPADGYLGARARGLGVEAKERPCWPWRISRSSASEPCMRAGDGEPAVRRGWPRALSAWSFIFRKCPWPRSQEITLRFAGGGGANEVLSKQGRPPLPEEWPLRTNTNQPQPPSLPLPVPSG